MAERKRDGTHFAQETTKPKAHEHEKEVQTEAIDYQNFNVMLPNVRRSESSWIPNLFNDFFSEEWPSMRAANVSSPAVNVSEDATGYHVEVAAPGMSKEDFQVHISDANELVVTMEKKSEPCENKHADRKYLRQEFSYSRFEQNMLLPDNVDKDGITAKMENGVLCILLPKRPEQPKLPSKVIEIQ